ncbi:hypothetical protein QOZ80_2BG0187870 [Eleusine coracana subsp. coracana]|nr:hypothetical protein QOZ80_2BG0187870 [Eleusine coracana subsp. coracana]
MAVQAQYLGHAFRHDPRAIRPALLDDATGASSVFLGDAAAGNDGHLLLAQLQSRGNTVFSDLTCNDGVDGCCFVPRKRPRVDGGVDYAGASRLMIMEGALLPSVPVPPQAFTGDVPQSREHGSGAASTSGRPAAAAASQGLLSQLHRHGVEIDALVRFENERLRAGLEQARRRHVRGVVSALERAAARRLRAAEDDLARALVRGAELEEKLRQMVAEGQAWQGVANGHEAAAAGLRATLDQLLQQQSSPCAEGEAAAVAEDVQSCCFERQEDGADVESSSGRRARACRSCGEADACVLMLPCRHLCLCAGCEPAVDACPVCAATKNASLHVLLD